jgi:hypothetical protein
MLEAQTTPPTTSCRILLGSRSLDGQTSLLVGPRSSAERRWVEAYRQTALDSVVCRRYFGYGVDNCRNVSSVGQPETMRLTQVGLKSLQNTGGSRMRPVAKYMARSGAIHRNHIKAASRNATMNPPINASSCVRRSRNHCNLSGI